MTAKRPSRRSGAARMSVTLPRGTAPASVTSFEEASRVVSDDIARRGWGASQWYGTGAGRILSSGIQVAYVSYNGRVWHVASENEASRKLVWTPWEFIVQQLGL